MNFVNDGPSVADTACAFVPFGEQHPKRIVRSSLLSLPTERDQHQNPHTEVIKPPKPLSPRSLTTHVHVYSLPSRVHNPASLPLSFINIRLPSPIHTPRAAATAVAARYIGLPTAPARYQVLHSCLEELLRVGIISPPSHLPPSYSKAVELTAAAAPLSSSSPFAEAPAPAPPTSGEDASRTGGGSASASVWENGEEGRTREHAANGGGKDNRATGLEPDGGGDVVVMDTDGGVGGAPQMRWGCGAVYVAPDFVGFCSMDARNSCDGGGTPV